MLFEADKRLLIIARKHNLTRMETDFFRKSVCLAQLHTVESRFLKNTFVRRIVRQHLIFTIREDRKTVFLCFPFEVRDKSGIDAFLEKQFVRLHIDDLSAVVREDISAVFIQLQFLSQPDDTVRRPSRSQYHLDAHLLHLDQGCTSPCRNCFFVRKQCAVYIEHYHFVLHIS